MRTKFLVAAALLVLCVTVRDAGAQQQFQLYASVVNSLTGLPVTSLEPTDVRVMEAGTEVKILKIEPLTWPMKLQLLLDNGAGLGGQNLQILKDGVTGLLNALPEGVEVTIVTTAPQPRFLVRATTDKKAMLEGLGRLAPDNGAGRFVESLAEATQRIDKDKTDHFSVIISSATTSGDNNVMDRDVNKINEIIQKRPITVHVVLLAASAATRSGGANQTEVGLNVTKYTGGRYESIAAASRLATLLPEIGKQVTDSQAKQSTHFRLTMERPAGAKGALGQISGGARSGLTLTALSSNGRMQ